MVTTAKAKFETQWSYSLSYGSKEDPKRSGMSGGKDTQGETIVDMFKMVTYYLSLGYVVSAELFETCKLCCGTGQVRKRSNRMYAFKKCPECKGQKPSEAIECGRFEFPHGVSLNNDAR